MGDGHRAAAIVEINSETDFVGRSDLFRRLVGEAAAAAARGAARGRGGEVKELSLEEVRGHWGLGLMVRGPVAVQGLTIFCFRFRIGMDGLVAGLRERVQA